MNEMWVGGEGMSRTWTGRVKWVGRNGTVLLGPNYWQQFVAWLRKLNSTSTGTKK